MKEMVEKINFIKIKNSCSMKDINKGNKRKASDWRKYLQRHIW